MPMPRKSVRRRDPSDVDSSPGDLVVPRKRELFNWDHINLGVNVELTSSDSDISLASSGCERGDFELDPNSVKDSNVDQATFEWVRNLVAVRKAKHQTSPQDHSFRTTGKGWLLDQHKALEQGTIPVTFKCIIAASGVSRLYNKCRDDFKRPEYRSRYWNWSVNFILLIDYFIEKGNVNVTERSPKKYHDLLPFLRNCKNQQSLAYLSTQREQLLTAMGVKWEQERRPDEDLGEPSDSSSSDGIADETWEMPTKTRTTTRPRRQVQTRRAQKKKRATTERDEYRSKRKARSPSPVLQRPPPMPTSRSLSEWAKNLLEVRRYVNKTKGADELYDIPYDQLTLKIWMNAEVARSATGTLINTCKGVLHAAGLLDQSEVKDLNESCLQWGKGFVAYADYTNRKGNISDALADFMYECRRSTLNSRLSSECDALLCGVDKGWLDSRDMQLFVFNKEKRQGVRVGKPLQGDAVKDDIDPYLNGDVVEVVLDSGTVSDERAARRKRKHKDTLLVSQMLTDMIGGEVAVTVEGRNPTRAERNAKEWVLKAGAKDFDLYGRSWFRAATAD